MADGRVGIPRSCSHSDDDDLEGELEPWRFEEDTFSLMIGVLMRDTYLLAEEWRHARAERRGAARREERRERTRTAPMLTRLLSTTWLLALTVGLQFFLLYNVKHLVSAKAVHDMRVLYDMYEIHMYGNNVSRMDVTPNGKHRGRPEYFKPSRFETLPGIVKDHACCIPLSQPPFFFAILFVWSVACVGELSKIWRCFYCLLVRTETIQDMADCTSGGDPTHEEDSKGVLMIRGVTMKLKLIFTFCFFIPRVFFTVYILWLGCRYLCASTEWSALVLNAMAFQFILRLKDIIYSALAPARTRGHLASLRMLPETYPRKPNHNNIRYVIFATSVTALWCWIYFESQAVIPDYRWDVHGVCASYLAISYAV